ncbi:hypothetical protein J6590_009532 [Homalodisca vitripennis]|nr:hypothetical protein J6590_103009 [Homalodisca vitripennis]KAG8333070.1 hypothetical protein J6590_009532 [Homalodisca vitripennis]
MYKNILWRPWLKIWRGERVTCEDAERQYNKLIGFVETKHNYFVTVAKVVGYVKVADKTVIGCGGGSSAIGGRGQISKSAYGNA